MDIHDAYKSVFFDGNKNKVLRWLSKKGFKSDELKDLVSIMNLTFYTSYPKYKHDHIKFEVWMWFKFNNALFNYIYRKNHTLKVSNVILTDDISTEPDFEVESLAINIGNVSEVDKFIVDEDFESIVQTLSNTQSLIARCRYYNEWSEKEIVNYLSDFGITKNEYRRELKQLRIIFLKYRECKI